jgi:hypothetical protein
VSKQCWLHSTTPINPGSDFPQFGAVAQRLRASVALANQMLLSPSRHLTQQSQPRSASYRVAEESPQSPGGSPQNSPQWASDSPQSPGDSPQSAEELPTSLAALLPLAVSTRSKKRLPAAQMREVILSLCEGRWLAAGEIALLVARDAEKLQSRFLTAMVREGLLELRHPDVPNRPDQAYRSLGTKT